MSRSPVAIVTGAAGFLGSHMTELLLGQGSRVRAIDNLSTGRLENLDGCRNDPRLSVDTRDLRTIGADDAVFRGGDYVFHFAGIGDIVPSIERPVDYLSANVMGTVHALEGARRAGARKLVYAASSSCYGLPAEVPTPEHARIAPQYPYALSKYLGEQTAMHWAKVYGLPVVSVRIFNAYGPRSRTTGAYGAVFGVFLAQKLAGKPFTVVGDGSQTRDFVFATDVVHAFWLAATSARQNEIYNVGAGRPQSVTRLVELLGGGDVVHLPKRPGEPDCTWADISRIRRDLGWSPKVTFEEGVAIMLREIEHWRHAPVWEPQSIESATAVWFQFLSTGSA